MKRRKSSRGRAIRQRPTTHLFPCQFASLERTGERLGVDAVKMYESSLRVYLDQETTGESPSSGDARERSEISE